MKISALKKMVREAVRAELKQMEKRLEESFEQKLEEALQGGEAPQLAEGTRTSDLSELRARFRASQPTGEAYDGLGRPTGGAPAPGAIKPKNKRGLTKDGEPFASGENILEWFETEKGEQALSEHQQALKQMEKTDEYVNKIIGKGRI